MIAGFGAPVFQKHNIALPVDITHCSHGSMAFRGKIGFLSLECVVTI